MTHPMVEALNDAVAAARSMDEPLPVQLQRVADIVRDKAPEFADAVDRFVGRLERTGAGAGAPQVGEPMPGFLLPDQDGRLVSLDALRANGPVAVVFVRGHWCPYCRLNTNDLARAAEEAAPLQLVLICGETQHYVRKLRADSGADFPFLSDLGNGYALSLNIAIWVDDAMSQLIAGAGWDVPAYQAQAGWVLPVPSVFVLNREGTIVARHVDPDYRQRLDLRAMLPEFKALLSE